MKLVPDYEGKDGNGEATYDFPAGTKIGFIYGSSVRPEKFYLSDAILSQAIHRGRFRHIILVDFSGSLRGFKFICQRI